MIPQLVQWSFENHTLVQAILGVLSLGIPVKSLVLWQPADALVISCPTGSRLIGCIYLALGPSASR